MGREHDTQSLVEAYGQTDSDAVRIAVLEQLAEHPDDQPGRALVLRQARSATTEAVKLSALRAASRYQGEESIEVLIDQLDDPWPAVRELSLASLSSRSAAALAKLREQVSTSQSPLMRAACVRLLESAARIDPGAHDDVVKLMFQAANDDAPKVREAAVNAFGTLGVVNARPKLMELLRTDPDASVRMSAERAIQKLGDAAKPSAIVAVLPLKNDTGLADPELDRFGAQLAEYLSARLSSGKVCEVIDPAKVEAAIAEMKKVGAAMYDGEAPNAPMIGRFKIANQMVYGSLQKQGAIYTIVLQRMELSTLAQVPGAAVTVQGYRADLEQLKVRAADQLLASFR
jgi:HEAT repeat protein